MARSTAVIPITSQTISGFPASNLTPLVDRLAKRGDVNRPGSSAEFTALLSDLTKSLDRDQAASSASVPDARSASGPAPAPAPMPAPLPGPLPVSTDSTATLRLLVDRYRGVTEGR
jgi:hypothetical protein